MPQKKFVKGAKMVDFQQKSSYNINDLIEIMKLLRSGSGCPWDKEQDHKSIRMNFLEETCEVLEAIDSEDSALLREELGDVLLQIVFHSQMEAEKGTFTFDDVADEICKKLIIRHPHVFGDVTVNSSGEVLKNWDSIKKQTKQHETYTETLKSVSKTLPALMRSQKLGKRASRAGMDFPDIISTLDCLEDEIRELKEALSLNDKNAVSDELGDVIFSAVNLARKLDIDAEECLTYSCNKFIDRFEKTEQSIRLEGISDMNSLGIDELNAYWNKSKLL